MAHNLRHLLYIIYRHYFNRPINQRHCYDYPSENNGWKKIGNRPVWGNRETGTMFDPYVLRLDSKFLMVVSARKTKSIILVESTDGECWKSPQLLLTGRDGKWDDIVNRGCLVQHNGKLYLWYTGQYNDKSFIGLAVSSDNKTYLRIQDSPVLSAEAKHEGQSVMNPCVIWDEKENIFKMWYSAGETYEPDVSCYAERIDGIRWTKHHKPVLTKYPQHKWEQYKIGGCHVVKQDDDSYLIYYIGYQNIDVARICMAYSHDGINWERDNNNLLIAPTKDSWDADSIYKPSVIDCDGELYLWYNGRKAMEEYIGLCKKNIK